MKKIILIIFLVFPLINLFSNSNEIKRKSNVVDKQIIDNIQQVCPYSIEAYKLDSTYQFPFYKWIVSGGVMLDSTQNEVLVQWNVPPFKLGIIKKISNNKNAVLDTIWNSVPCYSPQPPLYVGKDSVCINEIIDYNFTTSGVDYYEWEIIPNTMGSIINGQGTGNVQINWNNQIGKAVISIKLSFCNQKKIVYLPININPIKNEIQKNIELNNYRDSIQYAITCANDSNHYLVDFLHPYIQDNLLKNRSYSWVIKDLNKKTISQFNSERIEKLVMLPGEYEINLAINTNEKNILKNYTQYIHIPIRNHNITFVVDKNAVCEGIPVHFTYIGDIDTTDIIKYEWDFGDRSSNNNGPKTNRTYKFEHTFIENIVDYFPRLTIEDKYGCSYSYTNDDQLTIKPIVIYNNKLDGKLNFHYPVIKPNESIKLTFHISPNSSIPIANKWNTGANTNSIVVKTAGIYKLEISNKECIFNSGEFSKVTVFPKQ